jgi:long-chain acyl-CoA synthetase
MHGYLTQGLRRAVQINRSGTATIFGARRRTWSEILERVQRFAGALRDLGLSAGGRVAILALNSDDYLELHYAVPWAGGALVPINTRLAAAEVRYILDDATPEIIVCDEACRPLLASIAPAAKARIDLGGTPPDGWLGYEEAMARSAPADDAGRRDNDLAGIFYTGGSTGKAKGVMLSHDNLISNAMNAIALVGYDRTSSYLHAAPMFHLADGMATFAMTMVGGTHVMIPKFDAQACLDALARHRVTNVTLVPAMIAMMLDHPQVKSFDLKALRQIQFGASPMPEATLRRAVEAWPDVLLLHGWGMTELAPIGSALPYDLRMPAVAGARMRSCGHGVLNCEVMIIDGEGHEVPRGQVGELVIRGPNVMMGYWNKPEETAAALRNGWLHTGDAATMDDNALITIVDRLKDMIISGGENIYSTEVENAISLFPGVAQVAVIGVPDARWGEVVHAIVVPRAGAALDGEAIRAHCRGLIAGYKVPRSIEIRTTPLPLSGSGKVLKPALREEYQTVRERAESKSAERSTH